MCYTTPAGLLSYFVILCQPYTTFPVQTSSALRRMITYTDRETMMTTSHVFTHPHPMVMNFPKGKANKIIFFLAEINNFVYFIHLTKFITYLLLLLLLTMFCFFFLFFIFQLIFIKQQRLCTHLFVRFFDNFNVVRHLFLCRLIKFSHKTPSVDAKRFQRSDRRKRES